MNDFKSLQINKSTHKQINNKPNRCLASLPAAHDGYRAQLTRHDCLDGTELKTSSNSQLQTITNAVN